MMGATWCGQLGPRVSGGLRAVLQLDQRAAADISQFTERGLAVTRGLHELLGDELAALMIAAMRKLPADFIEHHVHIGQRAVVKIIHDAISSSDFGAIRRPLAHYHFFPIIGTKPSNQGFSPEGNPRDCGRGSEDMGATHQIASASLAALFSIGLLVTAHLFMEYRSARSPAITFVDRLVVPL